MLLKYRTRFKELVIFKWHLNYNIWTLPNKVVRFLSYSFRCLLKQCLISHFFQDVYSHIDFIHVNWLISSINTYFIHSKDARMSHLSLSGSGSALGLNKKGSSLLHQKPCCTFPRGHALVVPERDAAQTATSRRISFCFCLLLPFLCGSSRNRKPCCPGILFRCFLWGLWRLMVWGWKCIIEMNGGGRKILEGRPAGGQGEIHSSPQSVLGHPELP